MNTTRSEAKTGWETNVNLVFLNCASMVVLMGTIPSTERRNENLPLYVSPRCVSIKGQCGHYFITIPLHYITDRHHPRRRRRSMSRSRPNLLFRGHST